MTDTTDTDRLRSALGYCTGHSRQQSVNAPTERATPSRMKPVA